MLYLLHIKTKNVGTNIFTRIYFMFLIVHKVCTNYIIVIEFYTNTVILALFLGGFLRPQKNGPDYWVGPSPRKEIRFYIISFTTFHHLGRFFYIAWKDDKSVQELQQKRLSAAATNLPEESCPNKTQFKNQIKKYKKLLVGLRLGFTNNCFGFGRIWAFGLLFTPPHII